ncbi:hypothetical protein BH11BAC7_BH11BAC7_32480 [soil metagenome]
MEAMEGGKRMIGEEKVRTLIHDVRNPLSSIYLTIDSLRHAEEDGEDPEFYLQLLEKAAKNIEEILNQFSNEEKGE